MKLTQITKITHITKGVGGGSNSVNFAIAGLAAEKTDYSFPIYVHKGLKIGDTTTDDVFLNNKCQNDFSDVYFEDESGNKLDFYLHSHGNYEVVDADNYGSKNYFYNNGNILASGVPDGSANNLYKSTDGGETWNLLYTGASQISMIFIDSTQSIIFIGLGGKLMRSIDGGVNFTTVIDTSAVNGTILPSNITENINGDLYFGRYQASFSVKIYKSTDSGVNWSEVYSETTHQHVHGIACDPYTGYVYAGLDASGFSLIRSTDNGANWTQIGNYNSIAFYFGDGFRIFGGENGDTLVRTTNDSTFTKVLGVGNNITWIRKVGNTLFASAETIAFNNYPQLLKSDDDGVTWETVKIYNPNNLQFTGFYLSGSNVVGCEMLAGRYNTGGYYMPTTKIISNSSTYQALFYVKLETLPTAGAAIKVKCGGSEISTIDTMKEPAISNLLLHYKLDEGTGTTINDSSGNSNHGVLTDGSGVWNSSGIKRKGALQPSVLYTGKSYNFNNSIIQVTGSETNPAFLFTKNFTVLTWVLTSTTNKVVIGSLYVTGKGWRLSLLNSYAQPAVYIGDGTSNTIYYLSNADFIGVLGDNNKHMIGFTLDNSTPAKIKFIVDGRVSTEQTLNSDMVASIYPTFIGAYYNRGLPFVGDMDDVRIYNKALSEAEIKSIYESRNLI